jgi:protein TonB
MTVISDAPPTDDPGEAPSDLPAITVVPPIEPLESTSTFGQTDVASDPVESSIAAGYLALPSHAVFASIGGDAPVSPFAPSLPAAPVRRPTGSAVAGDGVAASAPTARSGNRPPRYPQEARRAKQEGTARLRIEVREDGTVGKIELVRSSGFPLLDRAAIDAVAAWRFEPAMTQGHAEISLIDLPIEFVLKR